MVGHFPAGLVDVGPSNDCAKRRMWPNCRSCLFASSVMHAISAEMNLNDSSLEGWWDSQVQRGGGIRQHGSQKFFLYRAEVTAVVHLQRSINTKATKEQSNRYLKSFGKHLKTCKLHCCHSVAEMTWFAPGVGIF